MRRARPNWRRVLRKSPNPTFALMRAEAVAFFRLIPYSTPKARSRGRRKIQSKLIQSPMRAPKIAATVASREAPAFWAVYPVMRRLRRLVMAVSKQRAPMVHQVSRSGRQSL